MPAFIFVSSQREQRRYFLGIHTTYSLGRQWKHWGMGARFILFYFFQSKVKFIFTKFYCLFRRFLNRLSDPTTFVSLSCLLRVLESTGTVGTFVASYGILNAVFSDSIGTAIVKYVRKKKTSWRIHFYLVSLIRFSFHFHSKQGVMETLFAAGKALGPPLGEAIYDVGSNISQHNLIVLTCWRYFLESFLYLPVGREEWCLAFYPSISVNRTHHVSRHSLYFLRTLANQKLEQRWRWLEGNSNWRQESRIPGPHPNSNYSHFLPHCDVGLALCGIHHMHIRTTAKTCTWQRI